MIHTPYSLQDYRQLRACNDNSNLAKAAMDWRLRQMQIQYFNLSDAERIDCCDESRLTAWQIRTGINIPTFWQAFTEGLLRTDEEIRRADEILKQLIATGRA